MKKLLPLLLVLALLMSCNLSPTPTPPPTAVPPEPPLVTNSPPATQAPTVVPTIAPTAVPTLAPSAEPTVPAGTPLTLDGISLVIPPCLPPTATLTNVPAQNYDPNGGPMDVYPNYRLIDFNGYPLSGTAFKPMLRIYPVADFAAVYALASENYAAPVVTALQQLLVDRPAQVTDSLPFLEMAGAAQVFHTRMGYLDFANGSGVRFLTSYGQYYVPYDNHDLFYTFQGLTTDGKYWISAVLPINHPILPPTYDSTEVPPGGIAVPSWDSPTYADDMAAYYAQMDGVISMMAPSSFTPDMDCLDQLIQSLNIGD